MTDTDKIEELANDFARGVFHMDESFNVEKATFLRSLSTTIKDLQEVIDDYRRLTRELDIAMHGEEGAAKQASLCDLIEPAKRLREKVAALDYLIGISRKRYRYPYGDFLTIHDIEILLLPPIIRKMLENKP